MNIIIILTSFYLFSYIFSCGMNTHQEVAYRALRKYKNQKYVDIIKRYPQFFQPGPPFPDWGYLCNNRDAAEYAHWPPFINIYVQYLKENYNTNDTKYEQLVSLLLGIESHQIADILWHWGKQTTGTDEQGFLHSMSHGASNCNDIWEDCHGFGDAGGDFFLSYRGNLKRISQSWELPLSDLVKIYQKGGFTISEEDLEGCFDIFYLGSHLEWVIASMNLKKNEINASFLTDDLDMFYNGGIDDMAINTIWKWDNVIDMIEGKVIDYKHNNLIKEENILKMRKEKMKLLIKNILSDIDVNIFKELLGMIVSRNSGSYLINYDQNTFNKNKITFVELIKQRMFLNGNINLPSFYDFNSLQTKNVISLQSSIPYSYFGKSFTFGDFDGDGTDDMAIGSPGYGDIQQGAVYILYDYKNNMNINFDKPELIGELYSRFGYSVTTVDINHDGIDDLVVSAPTYGHNGSKNIDDYYPKDYYGRIYIYYGKKHKLDNPDVEIMTNSTSEIFFNLGFYLNSGDCNNDGYKDLLIGSPYSQQGGNKRGNAAVLTTTKGMNKVFIEDADFFISGDVDYKEIGFSLVCENNLVVISATGSRPNSLQSAGSVYGYDFNSKEIKFVINSDKQQSKLGASLDLQNNVLVIGAPSYSLELMKENYFSGAVFIYNTLNIKGELSLSDKSYDTRILSNISRSRFGRFVLIHKNDLYIGSPQFSHWLDIEEGRILVYNSFYNLKGELYENNANTIHNSHKNGSRFGEFIYVRDEVIYASAPYTVEDDFKGEIKILI